ncbi:hypothetical protein MKEN_00921000 [Mycena kentingensis (nom. inval.)]|nr:hypothetical protein MKEN_00921000 [Mycena kentingensis (nom. inval.)]
MAIPKLVLIFNSDDSNPAAPIVARPWVIPGIDEPYPGLPAGVSTVNITKQSLFKNAYRDGLRRRVSFKKACKWGLNTDEDRVIYAQAEATNGCIFCLRFIFNAGVVARKPRAHNYRHYDNMLKEAKFYLEHGRAAVGIFIPVHYGIWAVDTGDVAGIVLVSITRWCGVPWSSLRNTAFDTLANRILVGRTLEMMHDAGLQWNGSMGNYGDFANVLLELDDPRLTPKMRLEGAARCYISGLAKAGEHDCERQMPLLPLGASVTREKFGCNELGNASFILGFMAEDSTTTGRIPMDARKWHDDYADVHQYPNSSILIAQRKRLFSTYVPVYHGLDVSFEDEQDHMSALVLRDIASSESVPPQNPMSSYAQHGLAFKVLGKNAVQTAGTHLGRTRRIKATSSSGSTSSGTSD